MRTKQLDPNFPLNIDLIKALFKNTPDGFILVDEHKRIVAINSATEDIMGWSPSEVIGKRTCDLFLCCEDTKKCPITSEGFLSNVGKRKNKPGYFHETAPLNKASQRRKLWLSCSPLANSNDEPSRVMIIIRDVTRSKKTEEKLKDLSIRDGLTGLYNHYFFVNQLTKEIQRGRRYPHPVFLLMIDIDDFKKYNDAYGHLRGDQILVKIAKIMTNKVRSIDFVARYGGEEFAIILPETDKNSAYLVAEKLRKEVRRRIPAGVTISIGVAGCPENAKNVKSLIKKADQALYLAKESGKDIVKVISG